MSEEVILLADGPFFLVTSGSEKVTSRFPTFSKREHNLLFGTSFFLSVDEVFTLQHTFPEAVQFADDRSSSEFRTRRDGSLPLCRAHYFLTLRHLHLRHGGSYGCHFIGYSKPTSHGEFLLQVVTGGDYSSAADVSLCRLARSVGKRACLVVVKEESCEFVEMQQKE